MASYTYLHHSGENISEGNKHKIIQSSGVGNLGQVLPGLQAQEGHGQHRGDPCNRYYIMCVPKSGAFEDEKGATS